MVFAQFISSRRLRRCPARVVARRLRRRLESWLRPSWDWRPVSGGPRTARDRPAWGSRAACLPAVWTQGCRSRSASSHAQRTGLNWNQVRTRPLGRRSKAPRGTAGCYLLMGLRKCTTVLSSLNMFTSSMSESGCTPKLGLITRPCNEKSLTELLYGSFQLLVLTDGRSGDDLLGSSLGTYSNKLDESIAEIEALASTYPFHRVGCRLRNGQLILHGLLILLDPS